METTVMFDLKIKNTELRQKIEKYIEYEVDVRTVAENDFDDDVIDPLPFDNIKFILELFKTFNLQPNEKIDMCCCADIENHYFIKYFDKGRVSTKFIYNPNDNETIRCIISGHYGNTDVYNVIGRSHPFNHKTIDEQLVDLIEARADLYKRHENTKIAKSTHDELLANYQSMTTKQIIEKLKFLARIGDTLDELEPIEQLIGKETIDKIDREYATLELMNYNYERYNKQMKDLIIRSVHLATTDAKAYNYKELTDIIYEVQHLHKLNFWMSNEFYTSILDEIFEVMKPISPSSTNIFHHINHY